MTARPAFARKPRVLRTGLEAREALAIRVQRRDPDARWTEEAFRHLVQRKLSAPQLPAIAQLAADMSIFAPRRLHNAYAEWKGGSLMRRPGEIAVSSTYGEILYSLVADLRPALAFEAGAGFGISGSYIAAALQNQRNGQLVSFEIGEYWDVAQRNIAAISPRARVINDAFENFSAHVRSSAPVDFAFIDAIHDPEVIERQVRQLHGFTSPGAVVVVDDVFQAGVPNRSVATLAEERWVSFAAFLGTRQLVLVMR